MVSTENYDGRGKCWACMRVPSKRKPKRRDPEWIGFRKGIIDALLRDGSFFYVDPDRIAGRCPICGDPLHVRFIGRTPAADFVCQRGCDELKITAQLGRSR